MALYHARNMSKKLLIIGFFFLTSKVLALGDFIGGIASEDFVGNGGADINYTYCKEFTPSNTYTLTEMRWYQTDAYLYDIGIYTDDAGTPDTRIVHATGTGTTGTNIQSVSGSLTNGTQYWLCKAMQNSDLFLKNIPGNNSVSSPTGPSLPSTFSTVFSNVSDYVPNISVYGTVSGPTPTPTPSPTPAPPSTQPQTQSLVEVYLTTISTGPTETHYHVSINNRSAYRINGLPTVPPFSCILCGTGAFDPIEPGETIVVDTDGRYNNETPNFTLNFTNHPDGETPVIFLDGQPLNSGSAINTQTSQPIIPTSCSDIFLFGFTVPDYFCMFKSWMWSVFQWIFGINDSQVYAKLTETEALINSKIPFAYTQAIANLDYGNPIGTASAIPGFHMEFTPKLKQGEVWTDLNPVVIDVPASSFVTLQPFVTFLRGFFTLILLLTFTVLIWAEIKTLL